MNNIASILSNQKMDFPEAIRQIIQGKKISKLEWNNRNYYGILKDGKLMIHKPDNKFYNWIINDGDINGIDWIII